MFVVVVVGIWVASLMFWIGFAAGVEQERFATGRRRRRRPRPSRTFPLSHVRRVAITPPPPFDQSRGSDG